MITLLTKTLRRELRVGGRAFVVTLTPDSVKVAPKGRRKGTELRWEDMVNGDAALAIALNASLGEASAAAKPHPK
jgi:hypothetical protein